MSALSKTKRDAGTRVPRVELASSIVVRRARSAPSRRIVIFGVPVSGRRASICALETPGPAAVARSGGARNGRGSLAQKGTYHDVGD
jgi:hypothetical protein